LYEREDDAGKQDENADGDGGSLGVLVAHRCSYFLPGLLDEVEALGVDSFAGHAEFVQGVFHGVLHGAGTADEELQRLAIGGQMTAQRLCVDVAAFAGPVAGRRRHHEGHGEV